MSARALCALAYARAHTRVRVRVSVRATGVTNLYNLSSFEMTLLLRSSSCRDVSFSMFSRNCEINQTRIGRRCRNR